MLDPNANEHIFANAFMFL